MIRRPLAGAVALALAAALVASPATAQSVLRVIPHADLAVIDPYANGTYIVRNYGYLVYDTLFGLDYELRPQPQMVESWTVSDNQLTWTFRLRDALAFHDGQKVRAADVVASVKRWGVRNDTYGQPLLAAAAAIEALDERNFRVVLKSRFPVVDALATLTAPIPFILPERLALTDPFSPIKDPTGSGPFRMVTGEWQPGHRVVFERNRAYVPRAEPPDWASGGKIAKVDRVEWLYIPDPVTARQALLAGEVDFWENVPNDYVAGLRQAAGIAVSATPGSIGTVRFNQLFPPFDNVKMRRAVQLVADERDYMAAMAGDPANWRTCYSVYTCPWGTETAPQDGGALSGPRDWDKAKQLIAEAGYTGEPVVVLDGADIPQLHFEALVTADVLKRLGLNVDLASTEWNTAIKRVVSKEPVERGGWNVVNTAFSALDMLSPATNRFLRTGGVNGAPPGWPSDERLEALRAAWFAASDPAARHNLAAEIEARAFEIVPYIPTGQYRAQVAYRTTLSGWFTPPFTMLWNIAKTE